jgi:hypothetical protein
LDWWATHTPSTDIPSTNHKAAKIKNIKRTKAKTNTKATEIEAKKKTEKMAEKQKLAQLATRSYKDQAVWFLNAFWDQLHPKGEDEKLWIFVHKAAELDLDRKAEGSELDEFQAHRFLEHFKETMTVQAMRDKYVAQFWGGGEDF